MTLGVGIVLVNEVHGRLPVHFDDDVIAVSDYFLGKPGIRRHQHVEHFHKVVQTPCADRVAMRAVNLRLVTARETGSELRAEILTTVAVIVDLGFHSVAKILVIAALAEEMTLWSGAEENAVFNFPFSLVIRMRFPTRQILAVEELDPFSILFVIRLGQLRSLGSGAL